MTFSADTVKALQADLSKSAVKSRSQAGRSLSYIEGWHAIAEANRIFGHDGWQRETVSMIETNRERVTITNDRGTYEQWRVGYLSKVRITVQGVAREGTGFGSGMAKPEALSDAIESAAKEAETDATKRALMTFGWPFGLALYDKEQEHVEDAPQRPQQEPPKAAGPKPVASIARDPGEFWSRKTYEIAGNSIKTPLEFADKFEKALDICPNSDALNKLEDDNQSHLAALHHDHRERWTGLNGKRASARKRLEAIAA